jgi:Protein of unknown function with HXXEE motif
MHDFVLWIATAAYGLHILEEHELNWKAWARSVLHLPVEWNSFYLVNALVMALGGICAMVGWRQPEFSLSFPAIMLVNATIFHVLPVIRTRVFSPGVITAVVLFYPLAGWSYYGAWEDGVLTPWVAIASGVLGALLMACPVVLLKVKGAKMFQYDPT